MMASWAEDLLIKNGERQWPFILNDYKAIRKAVGEKSYVGRISRRKMLSIIKAHSIESAYPVVREEIRKLPIQGDEIGTLEAMAIVAAFTDHT